MMPLSCAASSASAICRAMVSASSQRKRPACDEVRERRPIDQLQDERLLAVRFLEPVDRRDVRMIQRREHLRFALEARQAIGIEREQFGQDLQRNVTIQLRVARAVHLAHGAGAEQRDDLVRPDAMPALESRLEGESRPSADSVLAASARPRRQPAASRSSTLTSAASEASSDSTSRRSSSSSPARSGDERLAVGGRPLDGGLEQRLDALPAFVGHGRGSRPSSRVSHAFAVRHSRLAVDGETLSTHAASSIVSPPNARSSTILRQVLIHRRPGDRGPDRARGPGSRPAPPASLASSIEHARDSVASLLASWRRAWSTRIRRITCAATPKKCARFLPVDLALVDEPQIDLVHQGRRLERVADALASKLTGRDPTQLRVDERQQLIERALVAATPVAEERRDVAGRGHGSMLTGFAAHR